MAAPGPGACRASMGRDGDEVGRGVNDSFHTSGRNGRRLFSLAKASCTESPALRRTTDDVGVDRLRRGVCCSAAASDSRLWRRQHGRAARRVLENAAADFARALCGALETAPASTAADAAMAVQLQLLSDELQSVEQTVAELRIPASPPTIQRASMTASWQRPSLRAAAAADRKAAAAEKKAAAVQRAEAAAVREAAAAQMPEARGRAADAVGRCDPE